MNSFYASHSRARPGSHVYSFAVLPYRGPTGPITDGELADLGITSLADTVRPM